MRHQKNSVKLNRTAGHRRCMLANMLKALVIHGRIETTLPKAKFLRRYADKLVTLAKQGTLDARRRAVAAMMVRFNPLTPKEARQARHGDKSAYNDDRLVIDQLFAVLGPRFSDRQGGYTRILKSERRVGDNAKKCFIEYLPS